jgi:hypothetical protein
MEARVVRKLVRRFADLETLARERAYTVQRQGDEILWWRNGDPSRRYSSFGVGAAAEDILLDCSSKET